VENFAECRREAAQLHGTVAEVAGVKLGNPPTVLAEIAIASAVAAQGIRAVTCEVVDVVDVATAVDDFGGTVSVQGDLVAVGKSVSQRPFVRHIADSERDTALDSLGVCGYVWSHQVLQSFGVGVPSPRLVL